MRLNLCFFTICILASGCLTSEKSPDPITQVTARNVGEEQVSVEIVLDEGDSHLGRMMGIISPGGTSGTMRVRQEISEVHLNVTVSRQGERPLSSSVVVPIGAKGPDEQIALLVSEKGFLRWEYVEP